MPNALGGVLQGFLGDRIGLAWGRQALPGRVLQAPLGSDVASIPSQPRWVVQRSVASEDTQHRRGARAGAGLRLACHPPFCACVLPASTSPLSRHAASIGPTDARAHSPSTTGRRRKVVGLLWAWDTFPRFPNGSFSASGPLGRKGQWLGDVQATWMGEASPYCPRGLERASDADCSHLCSPGKGWQDLGEIRTLSPPSVAETFSAYRSWLWTF